MDRVLVNSYKEEDTNPDYDSGTVTNDSSIDTTGEKKNLKPITRVSVVECEFLLGKALSML